MMHFDCDYMNLCHPLILKRMAEISNETFPGYGFDSITKSAASRIRALIDCPEAAIYFLTGGTQTNMVVIDVLLKPWDGVICADCGHIAVHEAGAIEATGHKVLTLPAKDGKLVAQTLENYLHTFYSDPNWEHMVAPGLVYLTHPTECGTIYTLSELEDLHRVCQTYKIPLYIDGARLGYGLAANTDGLSEGESLPTLSDIARLATAFYIGGTKCGAIYGEAVVFTDPSVAPHFLTQIKRHGALLAKGFAAALQFDVLFSDAKALQNSLKVCHKETTIGISEPEDNESRAEIGQDSPNTVANPSDTTSAEAKRVEDTLYYQICRHGVEQAARLRAVLKQKGYRLMPDSPTNQLFVELTREKADYLSRYLTYGQWEPPHGDFLTVRFATSWATRSRDIDLLIKLV